MASQRRPQGYPKITDATDKTTIVDALEGNGYADIDAFYATLPSRGDAFGSNVYGSCILQTINVEPRQDTDWGFVAILSYDNTNDGRGEDPEPTDGIKEYWSFDNSGVTKPIIEANSITSGNVSSSVITPGTYHYSWDHGLATSLIESGSTDTEVETAITTFEKIGLVANASAPELILYGNNTFTTKFKMFQHVSELPTYTDGETTGIWRIVKNASKPGITDFLISAPRVTRRRTYKLKDAAQTAANDVVDLVGMVFDPANKYGIDGGEWLCISASHEEGDTAYSYVVSVTWAWANSWDADLYVH